MLLNDSKPASSGGTALRTDRPCWFVGDIIIHVNEKDGYSISAMNPYTGDFVNRDVMVFPYLTAAAIARQWQDKRSI